jgi:hypothetical protein
MAEWGVNNAAHDVTIGMSTEAEDEMASKICVSIAVALLALVTWLPAASAQKTPKATVNVNCCYAEKSKCDSSCGVVDAEPKARCKRDCEGRLRDCLGRGVFAPRSGAPVACIAR